MKKVFSLDMKYSFTQVLYFGSFCALMGYASVFLLDKGISTSVIGIVLALTSVISVFTQPMIASFADKHKKIELRTIINVVLLIAIVLSVGLYFTHQIHAIILCLFVAIATLMTTIQPLLNSLAFVFEKYGIEINYGIARGLGSAAYALVSLAVGYLVEDIGASYLPLIYISFNILLVLVVHLYVVPKTHHVEIHNDEKNDEKTSQQLTFIQFCKTYKKFMIMVLGIVAVFFTHTIINNFFIQVITPIKGTESDMGVAVFLAAIVELPAMSLFNVIKRKVSCSTLIKFSVIMFAVKHTITFFATNMFMIYIAQACQFFAYAIIIPASVYYVNQIIKQEDAIKGQSMVPMAITGSGIIANLVGGILLDTIGVHDVLMIGVGVSILGALIVIFSTQTTQKG